MKFILRLALTVGIIVGFEGTKTVLKNVSDLTAEEKKELGKQYPGGKIPDDVKQVNIQYDDAPTTAPPAPPTKPPPAKEAPAPDSPKPDDKPKIPPGAEGVLIKNGTKCLRKKSVTKEQSQTPIPLKTPPLEADEKINTLGRLIEEYGA